MALLFMAWPRPRPQGQTLRLRQRSMGKGRVLPNIVQLLRQSWCICSSWLLSKGLYLASPSLSPTTGCFAPRPNWGQLVSFEEKPLDLFEAVKQSQTSQFPKRNKRVKETSPIVPAFPSLSQRPPITIAIISEGGVVPAMACQRGGQAGIKATQLQRGNVFPPTLPSHLLFLLSSS